MDLSSALDPTLPLNEASVLPPQLNPTWSLYRSQPHPASPNSDLDVVVGEKGGQHLASSWRPATTNLNQSIMSSMVDDSRRMFQAGYTLKHMDEELVKLRNENFHLKLRIHLLEEREGLAAMRPEDKENVFRINLDLKVEQAALKQDIDEKNKMLEKAYIELDNLERDNEQLRRRMEHPVPAKDTTYAQLSPSSITSRPGDVADEVLYNAFGSLNLGAHLGDDSVRHTNQATEDVDSPQAADSSFVSRKLSELSRLPQLERQVEEHQLAEDRLRQQLEDAHQIQAGYVDEIEALHRDQAHKADTISRLETNLRLADEAYKESQAQNMSKVSSLQKEIKQVNTRLEAANKIARDLKDELQNQSEENAELQAMLANVRQECEQLKETASKSQRSLTAGLVQVNLEQTTKLQNELNKRNAALLKLKNEYETAKALVRRYREEKKRGFSSAHIQEEDLHVDLSNADALTSKEALLLRHELSRYKQRYLRCGADTAIVKAKQVMSSHMERLQETHNYVINLLKQRLEELAQFLQMILSSGYLDMTMLSDEMMEQLQYSLEDSRRLSKRLSISAQAESLTRASMLAAPPDLIDFNIPSVDIQITDQELMGAQGEDLVSDSSQSEPSLDCVIQRLRELSQVKSDYETQKVELIQLREDLDSKDQDNHKLNEQLSSNQATLEDVRVRYEQLKETLREKSSQILNLEETMRQLTDGVKEMQQLKAEVTHYKRINAQLEQAERELRSEMEVLTAQREELMHNQQEKMNDLEGQLAEARQQLAKYKQRKEKIEKAMRAQLAKTHTVLKQTNSRLA